MKNKNLSLSPDPFFIVLLLLLGCTYLNAVAIKDTFVSPANTISGELRLDSNSEINGTDSNGYVYTTNLSVNDGQCYDTDGNAVTCQAKGENVKALYFKVYNGDGSDGDKEISSDLTIDSSNIDSYDNVGKFEVDNGVALTLDDVTIHANGDFIFDDDAKDLTIKGDVVIYADKFELGNNVGINIASDASLRIITSDDVTIGDSSFIDTNGHPEHFALFTKATISFDDYTGSKSFDGFFYSDSDFTIGKDVNITGAVTGSDVTEVKDSADINFDSSIIENTDISELTEDYCSKLFGGPASTIDGGELDIETNVKLENTPSDGSLYTDNINTNDGKCYDTDGNEVTCKANNITAFTQIFTVYNGDGSDGDKEISSDLTIDSSNIDSYDNVGKFEVDNGVALTLDDVTIHANGDFIFDDDAKDLTIKGDVVIYADKFELGNNVGINIASDASLRIITSDDVTIGDSSFIDTNGHPEHFALFTKATISFDDYTGSKSFDGFFYSDSDFTIGKDVNITGAVTGQKVQIKDDSVIKYDSDAASLIANTGVCVNAPLEEKNYKFDAWDTFRDINDRNISTKIVNQEFNLTIASLDENGTDFQEFNGTVCANIDNNISKLDFRDDNTSVASFKVSRAIKDIRVDITWKKDVDESCPFDSDYNETNSTDNFAVRPEHFTISSADIIRAGNVFDFNVSADAKDYNTTGIGINVALTKNCTKTRADFNISTIDFTDGESNNSVQFGDVGVADINISDKDWANVDNDDTPQTCDENGTYICLNTIKRIVIFPDHFDIVSLLLSANNNFTYLSQDLNMSAILDINIIAQNKQNGITENYNSKCYAQNIDINISHNPIIDDNLSKMLYIDQNTSDENSSLNTIYKSKDIDINYLKENFTTDNNGSTHLKVFINFDRNYSKPVNPFDLNITDINITDSNDTFGQNAPDDNVTFYYGRVVTHDIETTDQNSSSYLYINVYCNACANDINNFFQDSLNWYRNDFDTAVTKKADIAILPKDGFVLSSLDKNNITISNITDSNKSKISFNINNSKDSYDTAIFHIKIPKWLWYNEYKSYNGSSSSDCSSHPCINYKLLINKESSIKSGKFNGSDIGHDQNRTVKRVGVKVFR